MEKTEFLTIFPTFEKLEVVRKTLPSIIEETKGNDAKRIVHDSSVNDYLSKICQNMRIWVDVCKELKP